MNACNTISLGWILTFVLYVGARARAIPDFYTDDDLNAWHKFGLRSFYGPWSVISRKPNGDFVSYADYGARVPPDFRQISSESIADDDDDDAAAGDAEDGESRGIHAERQYPSKYATGLSDFAAGYGLAPQGLAVFSNGVQTANANPDENPRADNAVAFDSSTDIRQLLRAVEGPTTDRESKRETLELIGIVGVISDDGESTEVDLTTEPINGTEEIVTGADDPEVTTTVTDRSINLTD